MSLVTSPMNPGLYMAMILIVLVFSVYVSILFLFCKNGHSQTECLFHRILSIIVLGIVAYLSVHRDTFLPFLGETVFPFTLVKDTNNIVKGTVSKTVNIDSPDGTKVAYWAAITDSNSKPKNNYKIAYENYANSSVASVKNGQVTLTVNCPSQYKVPPFNETLKKHIHYRIIHTNGMISEVHTVKIDC